MSLPSIEDIEKQVLDILESIRGLKSAQTNTQIPPETDFKAPTATQATPTVQTPINPQIENPDTFLAWDITVPANKHNVRVLCDKSGLSYEAKNLITACIQIESNFQSYYLAGPNIGKPVSHENIEDGILTSTDWGICQYNDNPKNGWIGPDCVFPSSAYVLKNTEACVQEMIIAYKQGRISEWSSYKNLKAGIYPQVVQEYDLTFT